MRDVTTFRFVSNNQSVLVSWVYCLRVAVECPHIMKCAPHESNQRERQFIKAESISSFQEKADGRLVFETATSMFFLSSCML